MKRKFKILSILTAITFCAVAFLNFTIYKSNLKNEAVDKNKTVRKINNLEENNSNEIKNSEERSCCQEEEGNDSFSNNSIYNLDAEWTSESNNKFKLSELKGNPVFLTMFFADCVYACPILVNDMKRIEDSIKKENPKNFKYVLVSINPEKDTPEVLKQYAIDHKLDFKKWILLNGNDDDVIELAALLGIKYKKISDRNFSHSNIITLLNRSGEIAFQQTGLNQDLSKISEVINKIN